MGRFAVVIGELGGGFLEGDRAETDGLDLGGGDEGEDVLVELFAERLGAMCGSAICVGWYIQ